MTSIFPSTGRYLLSYANANRTSTLKLVSSSNSATTMLSTLTISFFVYEVLALDTISGAFLLLCQDFSDTNQTAYLVPGQVSAADSAITIYAAQAALYSTYDYSVDPQLIRLSDASFALSYYQDASLATRYGTLDTASGDYTLSLSPPYVYQANDKYSLYFTLSPLSASSYLLAYYDASQVSTSVDSAGAGYLQVILVTVDNVTAIGSDATLRLSNATSFSGVLCRYTLQMTSLDANSVVLLYTDAVNQDSLTVQVLQVLNTSVTSQEVLQGASWVLSNGQTAFSNPASRGNSDLDIVTLDAQGQFIVMYSDLSNELALTLACGQVSLDLGI
jgi:hypothetical protein